MRASLIGRKEGILLSRYLSSEEQSTAGNSLGLQEFTGQPFIAGVPALCMNGWPGHEGPSRRNVSAVPHIGPMKEKRNLYDY